jgi:hypothetical protein
MLLSEQVELVQRHFEVDDGKTSGGGGGDAGGKGSIEETKSPGGRNGVAEEFRGVKKEIDAHVVQLQKTIVGILTERLMTNCKTLKSVEWGSTKDKINIPTKFTAQILSSTRTMYLMIEDILNERVLKEVFDAIVKEIITHYLPAFEDLIVDSKVAAQR